ncbi:AAA family ATPase [Desulfogranum mediterraneum]|uniref:AAA family ATPase n=1 Tax=Desulfogranum mediterraneum TaxID=160661 RepID=UPI00040647AC|nr:AAA family ATPase [Desulfogranum mediterraneum]
MLKFADYLLDQKISEGDTVVFYRGIRRSDKLPVVVKCVNRTLLSAAELNTLEYEYRVVRQLALPCMPEVYGREESGPYLLFPMEDFGGVFLREYLRSGTPDLSTFLEIAVALVTVIGEIHRHSIIHKNIQPATILLHPESHEIKLVGFGLAALVKRERQPSVEPHRLEGCLAYISPEQTGRMNRSLDYRTDFYSLGTVLYELLTGRPPFTAEDRIELLHALVARQPESPQGLRPDHPRVLSALIMKLLAKDPENRYQSTRGLLTDLRRCRHDWLSSSSIASFSLGVMDLPEKLNLPEKLYDRGAELKTLNHEFERAARGETRILLIAGAPGIGKTFLIQEIQKSLLEQDAFFIAGKFNQYKGNIPYAPLVEAFRVLIRHLLTLPGEELKSWRERIMEALSPNTRVLVELVPELGGIIEDPPPLPSLAPTEAMNRLTRTFQQFLRLFATAEHPLVLFIDDWQWADSATLRLVFSLVRDDPGHFLCLGAYRDTEVSKSHPFMVQLDEIRRSLHREQLSLLKLQPLQPADCCRFISDVLHCSPAKAAPLAELIQERTQGNPFFIKQMVQMLYEEEYLWLDRDKGGWCWDISRLGGMEVTDNVVDLLVNQFNQLSEAARSLLQLASCIGNQFDFGTLAALAKGTPAENVSNLRDAVAKGYLLPLDKSYKLFWLEGRAEGLTAACFRFAHDKIQQAAYALASAEQRQALHLLIGRMLLQRHGERCSAEQLFKLVDQFNHSLELISDPEEQQQLVRLNLRAARTAKDTAAHRAAGEYLRACRHLLGEEDWQRHYTLSRDVFLEQAEVEYLLGNLEHAEELVSLLLERVRSDLEKAEVYNLFIVQKTMSADFAAAIAAGRRALNLLGTTLPETGLEETIGAELEASSRHRGERRVADLIAEPEMMDERKRMQILLLTNLCSAAYRTDQDLFRLLVLKAVNISLVHGLVAEACYTFSAYGLLLGSLLGDYATGYQFGRLALDIGRKFNDPTQICRSNFVLSSTLIHWVRPAREADRVSDSCYSIGLDCGEFQFAGYILTYKLTNLLFQGIHLEQVRAQSDDYLGFVEKTNNRWAAEVIAGTRMVLARLTADGPADQGESEAAYLAGCGESGNHSGLCRYHIFKALALYVLRDYPQAGRAIAAAGQLVSYLFGTVYAAEFVFVESLLLVRALVNGESTAPEQDLDRIRANQEQMKVWLDNCPENFEHRYLLIEAELASFSARDLEAMELYDRAADLAHGGGFVQNQAIALERAAELWLRRGNREIAALYFSKAHRSYQQWGARAKLARLEAGHRRGEGVVLNQDVLEVQACHLGELEVEVLVKALQAISGEIILENLLEKLMAFVVMDAGAERGALFLNQRGQLLLEAESSAGEEPSIMLHSIPLEETSSPQSLIRYVARSHETLVIEDVGADRRLEHDPYIERYAPQSILCMPIIRQQDLIAVLYMENRSLGHVFTPQQQKVLSLLGAQVAISLENARLFEEVNREVVERRRAEEALRRSEERFRELADLLPQMIYEADSNGTITFLNRHGIRSFGYTGEELEQGLSIRDLVPAEEHAFLEKNVKDIYGGAAPRGNAYSAVRPDGTRFPVIAYSSPIIHQGQPCGIRGVIVDVTELRRAEAELKHTRNYLDKLLNTLPSILFSVDGQGRVIQWNRGAQVFSGRSAEEVKGGSVWEFMPMLQPFRAQLAEVLTRGEPLELHRQPLLAEDKRFFDLSFYPMSTQGEEGVVIRIDDVSELVAKEKQLFHAQKMESIGSLSGGLAHDFNNLLVGISGILSLVSAQLAAGKEITRPKLLSYTRTMETAAERAAGLVKQLQLLSRKQPLTLSIFSLSSVVANVLKICRNTLDKSIEIKVNNQVGGARVKADQGQLEQVLLNVCINAAHAMTIMRKGSTQQGGVLTISMEDFNADHFTSGPRMRALKGHYLLLRIRDTGVGMSPETLNRIFDPFFTTKEDLGSGLGLAMAYTIIRQHQGLIDVYSEPGKGSTINIFLPRIEGQEELATATEAAAELGQRSGRILVIDDEELVREIAREMLEVMGYEVLLAGGGDEGLALYREQRETIRAVLLDMAMPGKSGKEVFVELKQLAPEVRVILASGFRHDQRVEETIALGVDAFLQKPYSFKQLMAQLDRVLEA